MTFFKAFLQFNRSAILDNSAIIKGKGKRGDYSGKITKIYEIYIWIL